MEQNVVTLSKFLSLILRHQPEKIGIRLDENGWTAVDKLIDKLNLKMGGFDMETLEYIVENNNKKRFAFNADKTLIRASQGHSLPIDLGLQPTVPPELLYHGTGVQFIKDILQTGLQKQNRQHVHLSSNTETARNVGSRKGKPCIITIDAGKMHRDGHVFYLSENHVWLTDSVPPSFFVKVE